MSRTHTFSIRLKPEEWARIEAMAQLEKLSASTFVRRLLMLEADRRGIPQLFSVVDAPGIVDDTELQEVAL